MRSAVALILSGLLMTACNVDSQVVAVSKSVVSEVRRLCERQGAVEADVDGDGELDIFHHVWVESRGAVLVLCTAAGLEDQIDGVGMAEFMTVLDIEPDGRAEIFFGATTVTSGGTYIAVIEGDELRVVVDEDGFPLLLENGVVALTDGGDIAESAGWGCQDLDGDGQNELISVSVEFSNVASWTKSAYELIGSDASKVLSDSGTAALPVDRWSYPIALTSPCLSV